MSERNVAPLYLMCPPDHFGVDYVINPWMEGNEGCVNHTIACAQWEGLHRLLTETLGARVELVAPQRGLPDMVFTANAGLVYGNRCVPARLRPMPRRGEEPHFRAWFCKNGFGLCELPLTTFFEGAGDALFGEATEGRPLLWCAHGFRSDHTARPYLGEAFGVETAPLHLVDPRFYHLDTCFCPLPGGYLLWYPEAFDRSSFTEVESRVPAKKRHAVSEQDAIDFACNAVGVGEEAVVLNRASDPLREWLAERGFTTYETPLTEFMKSGGSAKCLTLQLT